MNLPGLDLAAPQTAVRVLGGPGGSCPLIYACPHAGRHYPEALLSASDLDQVSIRRSEDAFVDDLLKPSSRSGVPVVVATYARAFMDVNREPYELDQTMFDGALPDFASTHTARVAAGLGSVARIVAEGQEIYREKLPVGEAMKRIETVHAPYHAALSGLLAETQRRLGFAVLIDWHSMPSTAISPRGAVDIILGDRFGASCSPRLIEIIDRQLRELGFTVGRNVPFAGGYTTEHYGKPDLGVHALQIEINRSIYIDEPTLTPTPSFNATQSAVSEFTKRLKRLDWAALSTVLTPGRSARLAGE